MTWRDRLTAEQLAEIDRRADSYGAASRSGSDYSTPAEQREELLKIEQIAGKLWTTLVNINVRTEDVLEVVAHERLGIIDMDLTQRAAAVVRELRMAAGIAASEMEPQAGKPIDRWKHELAHDVKEIMRGADVDLTRYNDSDAADAIRYAFEHAGMNTSDVRKYL